MTDGLKREREGKKMQGRKTCGIGCRGLLLDERDEEEWLNAEEMEERSECDGKGYEREIGGT